MINSNPTLSEAVARYLSTSKKKISEPQRRELNNFIRWFGAAKVVSSDNFRENDVADYSESLSTTDIDYRERIEAVKAFLVYARKEGWLAENLAAKVKIKKTRSANTSIRQRETKKVPMTQASFDAMQKELEDLKTRRFQVIEDVRKAAADKDLKENAPYHAAREQKSHLDGRILEIEETIKVVDIIDEKLNDGLKVNIGNTVRLKDTASSEEKEYTLVSTREVDPIQCKISGSSPVGKATMGHCEGDTIEVATPSGRKFHYLILKINRQ